MSDMGRSMASFTADSLGWHDPLGALLDNELMTEKYGEKRYGEARNAMHRSGKDGLLIEIGKYGLTRRDLDRAGEPVQQGQRRRARPLRLCARTTARPVILSSCVSTWT